MGEGYGAVIALAVLSEPSNLHLVSGAIVVSPARRFSGDNHFLERITSKEELRNVIETDRLNHLKLSPGNRLRVKHFMNRAPFYASSIKDLPVLVMQG